MPVLAYKARTPSEADIRSTLLPGSSIYPIWLPSTLIPDEGIAQGHRSSTASRRNESALRRKYGEGYHG